MFGNNVSLRRNMKNNYFSRVFLCTLHNVATHELRNYSAETQLAGRARNMDQEELP